MIHLPSQSSIYILIIAWRGIAGKPSTISALLLFSLRCTLLSVAPMLFFSVCWHEGVERLLMHINTDLLGQNAWFRPLLTTVLA